MGPSKYNRYSIGNLFAPLDRDVDTLRLQDVGHRISEEPSVEEMCKMFPQPPKQLSEREILPAYRSRPPSTNSPKPIALGDASGVSGWHIEDDVQLIENTSTKPKRGWRFYGTFACLAILNFTCAVDATILSVALPTIAVELKGTTAIQAFWCGTSFLLTSTVFQPTWAQFSHIIGRKSVLLTALFLFSVGTVLASAANNVAALLVGRSIQGVGGGGLVTLTYVIISDMVSLRERGKWQAIISLQWAIGNVIGPVIGGAFVEKTTWRWIFWLNIPFCFIAAIGVPICLRLHPRDGSVWERLKHFDWIGSVVFIGATTSLLIPLTWGGVMYDWNSWRTLVPFIVGVVGLVGFVIYSTYFSADPLIRRTLFNSSTAITAYMGTLVHGLLLWSLLYYMPLYYEIVKGYGPINSGVAIFPFTLTVAPAAVIVGLVIAKTGKYKVSIWIGWFLTTVGVGLLIHLKQDTNIPSWIFLTLVAGVGTGMNFGAQGFACQASASNADVPFAGAMYAFFRAFGQNLGIAIAGVIFQNTFKTKILATAYSSEAEAWSRDASSFLVLVKTWSKEGEQGEQGVVREVVIQAFIESLRMVWVVMCALSGVMFVASLLWIKDIKLREDLETDQGFRYEKKKDRGSEKTTGQIGSASTSSENANARPSRRFSTPGTSKAAKRFSAAYM